MTSSFEIDRASATPVYVQLAEQIRLLIHRGALSPGDPMPTVRSLAVDLGVNANTVARVYRDLQREGVLRLERGVGTFVGEASGTPTIAAHVYDEIVAAAADLTRLCRRAGMTPRELSQLIDQVWKETQE